jgi:hypothetical protein
MHCSDDKDFHIQYLCSTFVVWSDCFRGSRVWREVQYYSILFEFSIPMKLVRLSKICFK